MKKRSLSFQSNKKKKNDSMRPTKTKVLITTIKEK